MEGRGVGGVGWLPCVGSRSNFFPGCFSTSFVKVRPLSFKQDSNNDEREVGEMEQRILEGGQEKPEARTRPASDG